MSRRTSRIGLIIFLILFGLASFLAFNYFQKIFVQAVDLANDDQYIYVPTDCSLTELSNQLYTEGILKDTSSFLWLADKKSFSKPKPGRYLIKDKMSNNDLVNLLRSGMQEPLRLTLNSSRKIEQIAALVGRELELDSADLMKAFNSDSYQKKYGFNRNTFKSMILPNTYEFYWNTSVEEFLARMAKEYKHFWSEERKEKAASLGLSQSEVSTLASIVQAEQQEHSSERARVAGLYLNRLGRRMRLQSDPTLIYALDDYSIKRVLNEHKEVDSPYNTYKHAGLPPGPINIPEISSIMAVLNAESHNYLYMCAKADFSGYHNFSTSLSQHNQYARAYQRELNRRRILQ